MYIVVAVRLFSLELLKGKPRLQQIMNALKKYRGPKGGKKLITLALLRTMVDLLDEEDDSELVLMTALVSAWHFMLRSAEYTARLGGDNFDTDRVLLWKDVKFLLQGMELKVDFHRADEVRITFGKTKTTDGGEVRSLKATQDPCCVYYSGQAGKAG